jgi:hypothetical protein
VLSVNYSTFLEIRMFWALFHALCDSSFRQAAVVKLYMMHTRCIAACFRIDDAFGGLCLSIVEVSSPIPCDKIVVHGVIS